MDINNNGMEVATAPTAEGPEAKWLPLSAAAELVKRNQSVIDRKIAQGELHGQLKPVGFNGRVVMAVEEGELLTKSEEWARRVRARSVADVAKGAAKVKPQGYVTVGRIAEQLGVTQNTVYQWAKSGRIPGREVQFGPNSYRWVADPSAARQYFEQLKSGRSYNFGPGTKRGRPRKEAPVETVASLVKLKSEAVPTSDLTQKLLDIADMVRNNPMLVVESCEVNLKFKG